MATDFTAVASLMKSALGERFVDVRATLLAAGHAYAWTDPAKHRRIVVHHTAGPRDQTVNAIDEFHRTGRGWPGIGYHFIARLGTLWYVGDVATERAHIWGRNADSIGISITGNYDDEVRPADEDVEVVRLAVLVFDAVYHPPLEIGGHGDFSLPGHGTACPGRNVESILPLLRGTDGNAKQARLDAIAIQATAAAQRFAPNKDAALTRAMVGQGMTPTGNETEWTVDGVAYVGQGAVQLTTGREAAFYCVKGDWSHVRAVPRG